MLGMAAAGLGLMILGGLNAALGLLGLLSGVSPGSFALTAVLGLAFVGLGWRVRGGSRQAALVGLVLLGALIVLQLVVLVTAPDALVVIRLAITGGLAFLLFRAQQTA